MFRGLQKPKPGSVSFAIARWIPEARPSKAEQGSQSTCEGLSDTAVSRTHREGGIQKRGGGGVFVHFLGLSSCLFPFQSRALSAQSKLGWYLATVRQHSQPLDTGSRK